jgi:acetyl-CoA acetyltransferase
VTPVRACISGVGRSEVGRSLGRDPVELAVDAAIAAIADAGLERDDIDGLVGFVPDQGAAGIADVQDALGLELEWYTGCLEGPSQLAAVWEGIAAVELGRARHVVAFHASSEGSVRSELGRSGALPGTAREMPARGNGIYAWWLPFGATSAVHLVSMYAQRHFHEYGTTREQLAQIALVQRRHAARNPDAIYRAPLGMDEYLAARMISEPLCLYDCDVPIDFGAAVVISSGEVASDLRKPTLSVEALSTSRRARPSWDQGEDLTTMLALHDAGSRIWERTTLTPADVDVAGIYDGFSFIALAWLEALEFCPKGEGGSFIEGGTRLALDGALPLNTQGGQLSAGRMHGWGYLPEVCAQLWEEAGPRQVPGRPRVGLVASGGGVIGGVVLLTRS